MLRFSARLVRPYWRWLLVVSVSMVVETAMSLASPWPLKIVLDSVFGSEPAPAAIAWLVGGSADRLTLLNVAVAATVAIALLQASNAYLNAYYDRQQTGPLISTITGDINTVQVRRAA